MSSGIEPLIFQPLTQIEILIDQGYSLTPSMTAIGSAYGIWATLAAIYGKPA